MKIQVKKPAATPATSAAPVVSASTAPLSTPAKPSVSSTSSPSPFISSSSHHLLLPSSSSSSTPSLPSSYCEPKTHYDFESAYRSLRSSPSQFASYLSLISPGRYPVVLKTALDSTLFTTCLTVCHSIYAPNLNWKQIWITLKGLSEVPRFGMAVGFLSGEEKKQVRELLEGCEKRREEIGEAVKEEQIKAVANKYDIKL